MNKEAINTLFELIEILIPIGVWIIFFLIIRGIWRTFKNFVFEVIDRIKGTDRNATPKQGNDNRPPWEK